MATYEQSRQKVFQEYAEKKKTSKKLYKYLKNSGKNTAGLDLFFFFISVNGEYEKFEDDIWGQTLGNTSKGNKQFNMDFNVINRKIDTIWTLSEMEKKRWQII